MMMSYSNTTLTCLFFLLIFFLKLSYGMRNNGIHVLCPEIEKQSLLSFKQGLKDPENVMSSWDGEVDCCKWKGVVCNNITGHVHELHLQRLDLYSIGGLSGKVNPSLLNLEHLRYLNLSHNDLVGTIPSFIGSFTNLEHLDLYAAGFHGKIPHNIGNLTNLQTLVLGENVLNVDSLEWLRGLSKLEYLNMHGVDLSNVTNWAQVINTLSSLRQLHLQFCVLDLMGTTPLDNLYNITSLTHLDLSDQSNYFDITLQSSSIMRSIFQLQNLLFLDLSYNHLEGPIPSISNATKLKLIDLSHNRFNSIIQNWLFFCNDLEYVNLGYNLLEGTISNAIANLTSLSILYLERNQLCGEIPKEIANLYKIETLYLSGNKLQGEIPDAFDKLSSLKYLRLSDNNLTGNLPKSFGQLFKLKAVFIDGNMGMSGVVTETHFANLTNLKTFSASGNRLTLKVNPNWVPPIQLTSLQLRSWTLLGDSNHIPSWLHTPNNISYLDLSSTGVAGNVPNWFWEIKFLNLSNNHLQGNIPYIRARHNQFMYLSSNKFDGLLPRIGDGVMELDLSNNSFSGGIIYHFLCDTTYQTHSLEFLHLGENRLSGELPNCWTKWSRLRYLNLGNNNMSGIIPNSIGFLSELLSLNLYRNKFSGQIPSSLHNCTMLEKIDLSHNNLDGNIPTQMGMSLDGLAILILRSNGLSGRLSSNLCHLKYLQILDLSNNKFSGIIPRCVYNFTGMVTKTDEFEDTIPFRHYSFPSFFGDFMESVTIATKGSEYHYDSILSLVTNIDLSKNNLSGDIPKELASLVELRSLSLSENQLTGMIPDSIGDMKQLESLDLSRNFLSGQIPNSFTQLSFLSYLNLSYNNLTGRIPEGTQLQSSDASSFTGNDLCGPPLTRNCSTGGSDGEKDDDEAEGDESETEWFWVFLSLGYAVGLSVVCSALVLKKSWRDAYFGFLQEMWNKFYVYVHIKWARFNL